MLTFGSSGDSYINRTTKIPLTTSLTWMARIRPSSVAAGDKILWAAGSGVSGAFTDYEVFLSTNALALWNGATQVNGSNLLANVTRHICITLNGTSGTNALVYLDGVLNISGTARSVGNATVRYGSNGGAEPYLGGMEDVKEWGAVLTAAEILIESRQSLPFRMQDLTDYRPFNVLGDLADYSGQAAPYTTTGTLKDGPAPGDSPVTRAWRGRNRPLIFLPSSGISGSVAETLSAAETASATMIAAAAIAETLAATPTQSATIATSAATAETLSAADAESATITTAASTSESVSAVDTESATVTTSAAISETLTAAATQDATVVSGGASTVSESLSAADSASATVVFAAAVSESLAAADVAAAVATFVAVRAESVTALDSIVATALLQGLVVETITVTDVEGAVAVFSGSVADVLAVSELVSAAGGIVIAEYPPGRFTLDDVRPRFLLDEGRPRFALDDIQPRFTLDDVSSRFTLDDVQPRFTLRQDYPS